MPVSKTVEAATAPSNAAELRSSAAAVALPAHLDDNPDALLYRLQRFSSEFNQRRNGSAVHWSMLSETLSVAETGQAVVLLARALADAMERRLARG